MFLFSAEIRSCLLEDVDGLNSAIMGVYARNQTPMPVLTETKLGSGRGVVVNTDPITGPGKHWVCYFNNGNFVEFWDSYGKDVDSYAGLPLVDAVTVGRHYQSTFSDVCGQYCIFFLYFRVRGFSVEEIHSQFSVYNSCLNDNVVRDFVCMHFDFCAPIDTNSVLQCSSSILK